MDSIRTVCRIILIGEQALKALKQTDQLGLSIACEIFLHPVLMLLPG